jgi:phosphoglycolate phosphatase
MAISTLIFDLDGTLIDTGPDLLNALNAILRREDRRAVDLGDLGHLVGHGAPVMLEEAFKMTGPPCDPGRLPGLIDDYIAYYKKHIAAASRPFPGVESTLARFAKDGLQLGVLTNKPQELTDLLLDALNLRRFFGAIHGAGRYSYSKPDARVFHHVVEELSGNPHAPAIMIGDSITDVLTARAAGAKVILVSYGYTPEPAERLGGDAVTDDFAALPALIEQLG